MYFQPGDNRPNPPVRQRNQALERTKNFLAHRYGFSGDLDFAPGTVGTKDEEVRILGSKTTPHGGVCAGLAKAMGLRTTGRSEILLSQHVLTLVTAVYDNFLTKTAEEEDRLFQEVGMDNFEFRSGY